MRMGDGAMGPGREWFVAESPAGYVTSHRDLRVYQVGFELALRVKEISSSFPREERFSLTDQILRSSRSICANISEAWRKRRYRASFISKLSDAEGECAETQVWLDFAVAHQYVSTEVAAAIDAGYEQLIRSLVAMIAHADSWSGLSKNKK